MRFNVVLIDPPSARFGHFLFDLLRLLQGGLEDLGHRCTLRRNTIERGAVNVLVGVHLLEDGRLLDALLDAGSPYVIVQTERLTAGGFNHVPDPRFDELFVPLAQRAAGIWEGLADNVSALAKLGIESRLLRAGFTERLCQFTPRAERDVDFAFVGSMTPHRRNVLETLRRLGYRVEVLFDDGAPFKNDLFSRTEVNLTLRQHEGQPHLPVGRLLYLVHNRCLVAGDTGEGDEAYRAMFVHERERDVIEMLRRTRANPDRHALADAAFEALRAMPMAAELAPLVEALPR
jgi:hypothetical protein